MPGDGWCDLEGGISRETRPSSSSLSESEMTSGGLGTQTPAALPCCTKPLGPGDKEELPIHHFVFKYTLSKKNTHVKKIYHSYDLSELAVFSIFRDIDKHQAV